GCGKRMDAQPSGGAGQTGSGGRGGGGGTGSGTGGSYGFVPHFAPAYTVNAIWGDRATSLWAVTQGGQLMLWDGVAWEFVFGGLLPPLKTIWGLPGQTDIYFAGNGRQLYHLRGTEVTDLSLNAASENTAVWAARGDQVWVGFSETVAGYGLSRWDLTKTLPSSTSQALPT